MTRRGPGDLLTRPRAEGVDDSCCFCGEPVARAGRAVPRLALELPGPGRTRLVRDYACHESCFQGALAPTHRTGSGRPVERSADGVIVNAAELTADDLVNERVLCPACGGMTFAQWPNGWDAHASHRCPGMGGATAAARKADFKKRFGHLFR